VSASCSHGVPGQGAALQSAAAMRRSQERQSDQSVPSTHCRQSCQSGAAAAGCSLSCSAVTAPSLPGYSGGMPAQWFRSALISSALVIVERPLMPISLAR
jgi:hypothetical protein